LPREIVIGQPLQAEDGDQFTELEAMKAG
jgi:hypothetical protein